MQSDLCFCLALPTAISDTETSPTFSESFQFCDTSLLRQVFSSVIIKSPLLPPTIIRYEHSHVRTKSAMTNRRCIPRDPFMLVSAHVHPHHCGHRRVQEGLLTCDTRGRLSPSCPSPKSQTHSQNHAFSHKSSIIRLQYFGSFDFQSHFHLENNQKKNNELRSRRGSY